MWRVDTEMVRDPAMAVEMFDGVHDVGDVVLRVPMRPAGVARLTKPWRFPQDGTSLDAEIAAGAVFVAQQYAFSVTRIANGQIVREREQSNDRDKNPVEWCVVGDEYPPVCVCWESPSSTRVLMATRSGALFGDSLSSRGHVASMPDLEIDDTAPLPPIVATYWLDALGNDGVTLMVTYGNERREGPGWYLKRLSYGRINTSVHVIEGVAFSLTPVGERGVHGNLRPIQVRLDRVSLPAGALPGAAGAGN